MCIGDPRFTVKISFENLNTTGEAGDRLGLARLLLDCQFSKAEQGSISFSNIDPMKLNAMQSSDMYKVDKVDFNNTVL